MKNKESKDVTDEDVMIFWSREKLEQYFRQEDQNLRRRRQRLREHIRKPQSRCASIKLFER
ncbi:MAG: hypothetical protein RR388_02395 [Rikenellaceae bacterium]